MQNYTENKTFTQRRPNNNNKKKTEKNEKKKEMKNQKDKTERYVYYYLNRYSIHICY
jgi:hypothetical protein